MESKPIRSRPAAGTICLALLLQLIATAAPQYQTPAPAPGSETPPPSLKKALAAGQTLIGVTITAANLDAAVNLANAGFDFLWIEMEHSPLTLESLRAIVLGTRGSRAIPITRVPVNEPWLAKRVLDVGSLGVIFPFTSTRALAEQAVRSCKYPPLGTRGYGPTLAASRWGLSAADYVTFANEHVLVVTIIEQKEAVDNIDAIASVAGIDVLFVGPNDLSFSLGVGGKLDHPLVEEAVARVLAAGRKYGVPVGYSTGDPVQINKRIAQGFRFFQASSDSALLSAGARSLLSRIERPEAAKAPPK